MLVAQLSLSIYCFSAPQLHKAQRVSMDMLLNARKTDAFYMSAQRARNLALKVAMDFLHQNPIFERVPVFI